MQPKSEIPRALLVRLSVNDVEQAMEVDARVSLLDALREQLGLTGTKKGCNQGACGACTVLIDGQRVLACLTLAAQCEGKQVKTVEGIADTAGLHPLQQAFIEQDGFQCGYCTPGQLCSAIGMASEMAAGVPSAVSADMRSHPEPTEAEIKERMSGNLCRCGAYVGMSEAIGAFVRAETQR